MSLQNPRTRPEWQVQRPGMMSQAKLKQLIAKSEAVARPTPKSGSRKRPEVTSSSAQRNRRPAGAGENAYF